MPVKLFPRDLTIGESSLCRRWRKVWLILIIIIVVIVLF
jgi:hypothetical protein